MDATLFNIHDIILISTAIECLLFAFILKLNGPSNTWHIIFICLLITRALICLHEVTFWGRDVQGAVLDVTPNLFFIGSTGYFIEGPLIALLIRTLVKNKPEKSYFLYILFAPSVLYIVYLIFSFYLLDSSIKHKLIQTREIAYSWHFLSVDFSGKILRSGISIYCLALISKNFLQSDSKYLARFRVFFIGFSLILFWELLLSFVKIVGLLVTVPVGVLVFIGVSGYYAMFFLLNLVILSSITLENNTLAGDIKSKLSDSSPKRKDKASFIEKFSPQPDAIEQRILQHIDKVMLNKTLFTRADLTLEILSKEVGLPAKELSLTINRYHKMNFYEFINGYRIKFARKLLEAPPVKGKYENSITEILHEAGFNSKSVFNTFFKKTFGQTPTQYRKSFHEKTPH